MSQARVMIPQPFESFGMYGILQRNETDGGAPKPTNREDGGSIRRKQAIGVKRGASINISQDLIGSSPNTSKTHTGKMQRGASRARGSCQ